MMIQRLIAIGIVSLAIRSATLANTVPTVPDVAGYDKVLQTYVLENGGVRYQQLRANLAPLRAYVVQMEKVSPHSHPELFPRRGARLAYWINAYNALVLWAFAKEYPEKRDRLSGLIGRGLFFYKEHYPVGGESLSLANIENDILREEFHDPRIHFAIVCASASCPWLWNRAYTGDNVEPALESRARLFLGQARNIRIDESRGVITLSKLFDWYGADFGGNTREILAFVARYRNDGARLRKRSWTLRYFSYDWSPNEAPADVH